eukprot:TRINITY_DN1800_c0_g1_i11.p1 TRINITY_DN1800_c0_g1~~TRINITY_DN1800_c0_g1_i11.p1  ORF type:complete len:407 (+),score=82.38 TRINITY_DN1800_c0_g1_i11:154-1374(+)
MACCGSAGGGSCGPPAKKECPPTVSCCGGGPCGDSAAVAPEAESIHENVKEYYGKTLASTDDLETNACMIGSSRLPGIGKLMGNIHQKVVERFYGCGSPIPPLLEGLTVLDLGCGTGTDVYLSAQLVGEKGLVIGIDMTDEQLAVAREVEEWQREKFGYAKSNVVLKKAFIEDLKAAEVADESVDVVISNCVVNLAPDKRPVLSEIARILKPGGELYFSDVFADRRIPKHLRDDKVLFGECLSGALYVKDFGQLMSEVGLGAWGVVNHLLITSNNEEILKLLGDITFYSLTVRAVKVDPSKVEDALEDFGQTATYDGAIPGYEESFSLDMKNTFVKGKATPVDGLTASLLLSSRYGSHFSVTEKGPHKGIFLGENAIAGGADGWTLFLAKEPKMTPGKCGGGFGCC